MAHDIFISYSHKDKAVADAVCASLEARGVRCWIAPRDVQPGVDWGTEVIEAISESRAMVLIFSSGANHSQQTKREVDMAVKKEVAILPFRIEDVAPSKAMAYYLGVTHWLDAMTPPLEAHLQRLTDDVKRLLDETPWSPPIEPHPVKPVPNVPKAGETEPNGNNNGEPVEPRADEPAPVSHWRRLLARLDWRLAAVVGVGALSVLIFLVWWVTRPVEEASPFAGRRTPFKALVSSAEASFKSAPGGNVLARLGKDSSVVVTGECTKRESTWWCPAKIEDGWAAAIKEDGSGAFIRPLSGDALAAGGRAKVIYEGGEGLMLRARPGKTNPRIAVLLKEAGLTVTGRPELVERFWWWPVSVDPGYMASTTLKPAP